MQHRLLHRNLFLGLSLSLSLNVGLSLTSAWHNPLAYAQPSTSSQINPAQINPSQINPQAAADNRLEGLARRQQGDLTGAIAAFREAVRHDPQNLNGQVLLGWTLHLSGQGHTAAQVLEASLRQDPVHLPSLNALGIVYLVQGRLWRSIATHSQAALLDPDNEIAFYNLSLAFERLGLSHWSIATAEAACDREPHNPHPFVALALGHWQQGDRLATFQAYGQALALDHRYGDRLFLEHLIEAGFSPSQVATSQHILDQTP